MRCGLCIHGWVFRFDVLRAALVLLCIASLRLALLVMCCLLSHVALCCVALCCNVCLICVACFASYCFVSLVLLCVALVCPPGLLRVFTVVCFVLYCSVMSLCCALLFRLFTLLALLAFALLYFMNLACIALQPCSRMPTCLSPALPHRNLRTCLSPALPTCLSPALPVTSPATSVFGTHLCMHHALIAVNAPSDRRLAPLLAGGQPMLGCPCRYAPGATTCECCITSSDKSGNAMVPISSCRTILASKIVALTRCCPCHLQHRGRMRSEWCRQARLPHPSAWLSRTET